MSAGAVGRVAVGLPAPLLVRTILKVGAYWAVVRAAVAAGGLFAVEPVVSALVVAAALFLLRVDLGLLRESLFVENLGVGTVGLLSRAAVPVVALEIAASVAAHALGLP